MKDAKYTGSTQTGPSVTHYKSKMMSEWVHPLGTANPIIILKMKKKKKKNICKG